MKHTTLLSSLLLFPAAAAAQTAPKAPAYDAEWVGYDLSLANQARWPRAFRAGDLDGDGDLDYAVVHGASIPALTLHFIGVTAASRTRSTTTRPARSGRISGTSSSATWTRTATSTSSSRTTATSGRRASSSSS